MVSVPYVLWVVYHLVALPMAVWTAIGATFRGTGKGARHRLTTAAAAAALPAVALGTIAGAVHEVPALRFGLVPFALLGLAASWANAVALHDRRWLAKFVHLPVVLWNAAICSAIALRALQDLAGVDCGVYGTTWSGAHAVLQTWVGGPTALVAPIWLHLPICVPAGARSDWTHRVALLACATAAGLMLVGFIAALPSAHARATTFRESLRETPPLREDQVLGVAARPESLTPAGDAWLDAVGARAITFDVDPDLVRDARRLADAREIVDRARGRGMHIIAIARPPAGIARQPVADAGALLERMAELHWLTAERLEPDLLVLFHGPYGSLRSACSNVVTVEGWVETCRRAADEVRVANPKVRVAVALESRTPHAQRLFRRLSEAASPLAAVALVGAADAEPPEVAIRTFGVVEAWLDASRPERPIWLLGVGAATPAAGGEVGQWAFLQRALDLAARRQEIVGLCIRALEDDRGAQIGLLAPGGRPRQAFDELVARSRLAVVAPAPR